MDKKSSKQHVAQVRVIMKCAGEKQLSAAWSKSVLDTFITYAEERKFLSATVKTYLNRPQHLYRFVNESRFVNGEVHCSEVGAKAITMIKERVSS